ncbi:MAG: hypothetical protein SGILL_002387 [Bacillariaceae sp.]
MSKPPEFLNGFPPIVENLLATDVTEPKSRRLPEACLVPPNNFLSASKTRPGYPLGRVHFNSIQNNVEKIPTKYLFEQPVENFEPMVLLTYDKEEKRVVQHDRPFKDALPVNRTMVCIPEGIVADNSIGGPYRLNETYAIYLYQWLKWHPQPFELGDFLDRKPKILDVPGLGVQISSWTGFVYNHFLLDTFVRIGLVYDLLKSDLPLWKDAKLIIATSDPNPTRNHTKGPAVHKFVRWMYDRLNLTDRLISNNGWLKESNHTYRFEYLVLPDVSPHPTCGTDRRVKLDPCFPRGVLRPIQTALGSLVSNVRRYVVYAHRSNNIPRGVSRERERDMLASVQSLLDERRSNLELITFEVDKGDPERTLKTYQQAAVTFGPHGAQLWNGALSPPGGLFVEFNTWNDTFLNDDCRAHGYSLANAAGLDYALVEATNFSYSKPGLLPDVEALVEIMRHFLDRKGW